MNISRTERAILYNQLLIMDMLAGPTDDAGEKAEREQAKRALAGGYEGAYGDVFSYIDKDVLSPEECRVVSDVLWMFEVIERKYNESDDKLGVEEWQVRFKGWDSSTEPKQYGYAKYLVACGSPWSTLAHRAAAGDGAISQLPRYKVMLKAWRALTAPYDATMRDVKAITDAWTAYRESSR